MRTYVYCSILLVQCSTEIMIVLQCHKRGQNKHKVAIGSKTTDKVAAINLSVCRCWDAGVPVCPPTVVRGLICRVHQSSRDGTEANLMLSIVLEIILN